MNIYVSNISFSIGDAELNELFSAYGIVNSAKVITDKASGRSRGFGFVEMSAAQEGEKAIAALNNKEIEGRPLSVSIAREKSTSGYDKKW